MANSFRCGHLWLMAFLFARSAISKGSAQPEGCGYNIVFRMIVFLASLAGCGAIGAT